MIKKLLLLSLLTIVTTCNAQPPLPPASPLVTLTKPKVGITCSGIAVGHNTVLTAKHCVVPKMPEFNGKSCPTDKILADDGTDNVLVSTCQSYPATATMAKGALQVGEEVELWGHGGGLPWIYRKGYLAGAVFTRYAYPDSISYVFDMTVLPGDSGGPVFNSKGEVVCPMSYSWADYYKGDHLSACFPMKFTQEQLELIK